MRHSPKFAAFLTFSLITLATFTSAMAEPPATDISTPPLCSDANYLNKIKQQYDTGDILHSKRKIKTFQDIKETHYGPSPESINVAATAQARAVNSRYCSAHITLDDDSAEALYWRLDYYINGNQHTINYLHCSKRHDLSQNRCAHFLEAK
jgi:hypothetical protein